MNEEDYRKQLEREQQSNNSGYKKFLKEEREHEVSSDGSNTVFGITIKKRLLQDVVDHMEKNLEVINLRRSDNQVKIIIQNLLSYERIDDRIKVNKLINLHEWSFIGFQLVLDTVLNPNFISHKVISKTGSDKKLMEKKSLRELYDHVGKVLNKQIHYQIINLIFPEHFRRIDRLSQKSQKDGNRSSSTYWEYNVNRSIRELSKDFREKGDVSSSKILDKKPWTYRECQLIGSWIVTSIIDTTELFDVRREWRRGNQSNEIYLNDYGESIRKDLLEQCRRFSHDLLPMLIEPQPVTNESIGGWLLDSLQTKQSSKNGHIELSPRHLEFINRQQRVPFEINPDTYKLMEKLIEYQLPLSKFHYQTLQDVPSVSQLLGYGEIQDKDEQDQLVRNHPDYKETKRERSRIIDINKKMVMEGLLCHQVIDKCKKVVDDEKFYIPMKPDFRGRIYSRVPFISFQSHDSGRYLLRFHNKTPIDDRTEYWYKIGISNSCGNDKLSFDRRIQWFDSHRDQLINVGRMIYGGDFDRGYQFLKDQCDDPFCVFSLCNEYFRIFEERSQEYSQCYVNVDCSCSGTSIFNTWRRNRTGGILTNLIDTPYPQDIYTEVWNEIQKNVKPNTFRPDHIQELERTKKIRKMIKDTYIPTQYSQPLSQQKYNLRTYNREELKPIGLDFTDQEMDEFVRVWDKSFDRKTSINTVIRWFKLRTREILDSGKNCIYYTSCNGSKMTMKYPKTKRTQIHTFGFGSMELTVDSKEDIVTENVNRNKMLSGVVPNITHLTDSSSLSESFWNYDGDFITIHDSVGLPPGKKLDEGVVRLKEGFITSTKYNVWDQFRIENDLPIDPQTSGPVVGDLDIEEIRGSHYLYS